MKIRLDKIDLKILSVLQAAPRITNKALADRVALSASACLARVQRLREQNVIVQEFSVVDVQKFGASLHALLEVTLESHTLAHHRRFEKLIGDMPEVMMAVKVSGRFDYLLLVVARDMGGLSLFSDGLLEGRAGVAKLVTIPVLDVAKAFSGWPLGLLAKDVVAE